MSFKTKTILLFILLSLTPYVITLTILNRAYHSDFEMRLRSDMDQQLGITVDRLDQALQTLNDDLRFMASLDVMNDVLTEDLDHRILNLLLMKKKDLALEGDFDVVDNSGKVVASSDARRIGTMQSDSGFMTIPLYASFDQKPMGQLLVHYALSNLSRLFAKDEHFRYSLKRKGDNDIEDSAEVLVASRALRLRPELSVVLEQDKSFAFSVLNRFTKSLHITLVIGVIVISVIALLAANYILTPILQLSSTAKSITKTQDYSQRVDVARSDEIGQLSTAFNSMISGMQDMIVRLKEEGENRLKLVKEQDRAEMLQSLSTKLSKYVSPQIYESIFSGEKDVTLGSSRKKLTIFFADIVNFTPTTDQMESEDLTRLLNQYLHEMTNIALRHGATIDKYIGDSIMIFFGDPSSRGVKEDAQACVEMAIAMQKRIGELRGEWLDAGFTKPFAIRAGIHTGYCTVGNFGAENRMDYTIIGSAVNLANRIEAAAEPRTIYISEDTYLLVKDTFDCVPATSVPLKGVSQPVPLYKVLTGEASQTAVVINEVGCSLTLHPEEMSTEGKRRLKDAVEGLS